MKTLTKIKLGNIQPNPLNIHNNDSSQQVKIIADSISTIGLESPLVVYEDKEFANKKMYTIISGHKRYEALKQLGKPPIYEVPCVVEDKPKDEIAEREILLQNNLGRKSPEEIKKQVQEASRIWNKLSPDVRQKYTDAFKNQFVIEESKNHKVDDKYIRDNFRPRLEYIKRMSGLDMSNSTVKSLLKTELEKVSEGFVQEVKEKTVSIKDILRRVNTLSGLIEICKETNEDMDNATIKSLDNLNETLKDVAASLG